MEGFNSEHLVRAIVSEIEKPSANPVHNINMVVRKSVLNPTLLDYLHTKKQSMAVLKNQLDAKLSVEAATQNKLSKFYGGCNDIIEKIRASMRSSKAVDNFIDPLLDVTSTMIGATGAYFALLSADASEFRILNGSGSSAKHVGRVLRKSDGGMIWGFLDGQYSNNTTENAISTDNDNSVPIVPDAIDNSDSSIFHVRHAMDIPSAYFFDVPQDGSVIVVPITIPNFKNSIAVNAAVEALSTAQEARLSAEAEAEAAEIAKREAADAARMAKLKSTKSAKGKAAIAVSEFIPENDVEEPLPLEEPFDSFQFGSTGPSDFLLETPSTLDNSEMTYLIVFDTIGFAPRFPVSLPKGHPDGSRLSSIRRSVRDLPSRLSIDTDRIFSRTQVDTIKQIADVIKAEMVRSDVSTLVRAVRIQLGFKRGPLNSLIESARVEREAREEAAVGELEKLLAAPSASGAKSKAKGKTKSAPVPVVSREISDSQKDAIRLNQMEMFAPMISNLTSLLLANTAPEWAFNDGTASGELAKLIIACCLQAGFRVSDIFAEWGIETAENFGSGASNNLSHYLSDVSIEKAFSVFGASPSELQWNSVRKIWTSATLRRIVSMVNFQSGAVGSDASSDVPSLLINELTQSIDIDTLDKTFLPWGELAEWLKLLSESRRSRVRIANEIAEEQSNVGFIIRTISLKVSEEYEREIRKAKITLDTDVDGDADIEANDDKENGQGVEPNEDDESKAADEEELISTTMTLTRTLEFTPQIAGPIKRMLQSGGNFLTPPDISEPQIEEVEDLTSTELQAGRRTCIVLSQLNGRGVAMNREVPKDVFDLSEEEKMILKQQVTEGGARLVVVADANDLELKSVRTLNETFGWNLKAHMLHPEDAVGHLAVTRVPLKKVNRFPISDVTRVLAEEKGVESIKEIATEISASLACHNPPAPPIGIKRNIGATILIDETSLPAEAECITSSSLVDAAVIRVGRGYVVYLGLPLAQQLVTPPALVEKFDVDGMIESSKQKIAETVQSEHLNASDPKRLRQIEKEKQKLLKQQQVQEEAALIEDAADDSLVPAVSPPQQLEQDDDVEEEDVEEDSAAFEIRLAAAKEAGAAAAALYSPHIPTLPPLDPRQEAEAALRCTTETTLRALESILVEMCGAEIPSIGFLERAEALEKSLGYPRGTNPLSAVFEATKEGTEPLDWKDFLALVDVSEDTRNENEDVDSAVNATSAAAAAAEASKVAAAKKAAAKPAPGAKRSAAAAAAAAAEERIKLEKEALERVAAEAARETRAALDAYHREIRLRYRMPFLPSFRVHRHRMYVHLVADIIQSLVEETYLHWNFEQKPQITYIPLTEEELLAATVAFEDELSKFEIGVAEGQIDSSTAPPVLRTTKPLVEFAAATNDQRPNHKLQYITFPPPCAPYDASDESIAAHEAMVAALPPVLDEVEVVPSFLGSALRISQAGRQGLVANVVSWMDETSPASRLSQREFKLHEVDDQGGWSVAFWVRPCVRGERSEQRVCTIKFSDERLLNSVEVSITPDERVKITSGRQLGVPPPPPPPPESEPSENEESGNELGDGNAQEETVSDNAAGANQVETEDETGEEEEEEDEDQMEVEVPDEDPLLEEISEEEREKTWGLSSDAVVFGEWNLIVVSQSGVYRTLHVNGHLQESAHHYVGLCRLWNWPFSSRSTTIIPFDADAQRRELEATAAAKRSASASISSPKAKLAKPSPNKSLNTFEEDANAMLDTNTLSNSPPEPIIVTDRVQCPPISQISFGMFSHPDFNVGFGGELAKISVFDHAVSDSCVKALFLSSLYLDHGYFTTIPTWCPEHLQTKPVKKVKASIICSNPLVDDRVARILSKITDGDIIPDGCSRPPIIPTSLTSEKSETTNIENDNDENDPAYSFNVDKWKRVNTIAENACKKKKNDSEHECDIQERLSLVSESEIKSDLSEISLEKLSIITSSHLSDRLVASDCLIIPTLTRRSSVPPPEEVVINWRLNKRFFEKAYFGPDELDLIKDFVALKGKCLVVMGDSHGFSLELLYSLFPHVFPQFPPPLDSKIFGACIGADTKNTSRGERIVNTAAGRSLAYACANNNRLPPALPFSSRLQENVSLAHVNPFLPKALQTFKIESDNYILKNEQINSENSSSASNIALINPSVDPETQIGRCPLLSTFGAVPPELLPSSACPIFFQSATETFYCPVGEGSVVFFGFTGSLDTPEDIEQDILEAQEVEEAAREAAEAKGEEYYSDEELSKIPAVPSMSPEHCESVEIWRHTLSAAMNGPLGIEP